MSINQIIRIKTAYEILGISRSNFYQLVSNRVFPEPIKLLGGRLSGYLSSEIDALVRAIASGADEARLSELSAQLIAQRSEV
jgi:predicted DNA-binding transcriptional regulator AlpA